jgi:hypothetical protein
MHRGKIYGFLSMRQLVCISLPPDFDISLGLTVIGIETGKSERWTSKLKRWDREIS